MVNIRPIHPFPARMAPEVALQECVRLSAESLVLDPMVGSGTVVRTASEHGHRAIGFDMDPLAVLMATVWATPLDAQSLRDQAKNIAEQLKTNSSGCPEVSWIDGDPETKTFVDYWFGPDQQANLRRLSLMLQNRQGAEADALRLALSRIIVTKDRGASLARDVSHSRPHRVIDENDFDIAKEFLRSAQILAQRLEAQPPPGGVSVNLGDARNLDDIDTSTVDAVITSPPYLNAIDYIRGHRLALVWLGHRLADLRTIRSGSIGAERRPDHDADLSLAHEIMEALVDVDKLPAREHHMVERYVLDLHQMMAETHRVLRPGGTAVFVVGNSTVRSVFVRNTAAVVKVATMIGFRCVRQKERELPPNRRYLPPPSETNPSRIEKRMRTEAVVAFERL